MKKILIEGMSENLGGIETFVHNLYLILKDRYQVDFITVNESIPFQDEFKANGSVIHRITPRYKSVISFKSDINKVFGENNYDVFWFNRTTLSSIDTMRSAKKHGVLKVICHSHQSKNMGSAFTAIMHNINRKKCLKYIDYKAACSGVAAKYFFGKNISDVRILPNAVDISKYEPSCDKQVEMKKKLGLEGKFLVGDIARFAPEKNHTFLIDIFEKLLEKEENAHLILCGNGELMNEIKNKVAGKNLSDKVYFLGMRKDIPDILQALDVFVMPSLFEGLPFVLVESQASGVPCVVADTISPEAKLTDILEYIDLNAGIDVWVNEIMKYREYKKVSKREMLDERGFSLEAFKCEVDKIILG